MRHTTYRPPRRLLVIYPAIKRPSLSACTVCTQRRWSRYSLLSHIN